MLRCTATATLERTKPRERKSIDTMPATSASRALSGRAQSDDREASFFCDRDTVAYMRRLLAAVFEKNTKVFSYNKRTMDRAMGPFSPL